MRNYLKYLFVLTSVLLVGCVSVQPFPHAVRAGDTITLSLGSLDDFVKNEVTVTYFANSAPNTPIDVTSGIRSVFNIFPDKRSKAYWDTFSGSGLETMNYVESISGHSAWQTLVAVDLPVTLPVGTGHFVVNLGPNVIYPRFIAKAEDVTINAEILAPGGDVHDFEYRKEDFTNSTATGDLDDLAPLKQIIVRSPDTYASPLEPVAAAEYNFIVPIVDGAQNDVTASISDTDLAIILDDQLNFHKNQTSLTWSRTGQNIKVIVVSHGGNQDANKLRFSIMFVDYVKANFLGYSLADTASLVDVAYYDINGDVMSAGIPELVVRY